MRARSHERRRRIFYAVRTAGGDDVGVMDFWSPPQVGDDLALPDGRRARVRSTVPLEKIAEFVDSPETAILEVETY